MLIRQFINHTFGSVSRYLPGVGTLTTLMVSASISSFSYAIDDKPPPSPDPMSREEVIGMVDSALPSLIAEDNSGLVKQMLSARLGSPISKNLNVDQSIRTVFGRQRPVFDPDCQRSLTESGDPSPEQCTAFTGNADGAGAYRELAWDKQLGFGNLHYLRRSADGTLTPDKLPAVQMSDQQAYETAVKFLVETLGVPAEEIPQPPPDAKFPLPVRTLMVGEVTPESKRAIPVMKLVQIQRGLLVNLQDPATGRELPYLHGPGEAFVLLNDSGIWQARVQKWRELEREGVNPVNAKSRSELVNEIADSVMRDNARINTLRANIVLQAMDVKPGAPSASALMVPGLEISVAVVPRDPSEAEQNRLGPNTAGEVLTFPLVELAEADLRGNDND